MSFWAAATPVVVLTERAIWRAPQSKQGHPVGHVEPALVLRSISGPTAWSGTRFGSWL